MASYQDLGVTAILVEDPADNADAHSGLRAENLYYAQSVSWGELPTAISKYHFEHGHKVSSAECAKPELYFT